MTHQSVAVLENNFIQQSVGLDYPPVKVIVVEKREVRLKQP